MTESERMSETETEPVPMDTLWTKEVPQIKHPSDPAFIKNTYDYNQWAQGRDKEQE